MRDEQHPPPPEGWIYNDERAELGAFITEQCASDPAFRAAFHNALERDPHDITTAYAAGEAASGKASVRDLKRELLWRVLEVVARTLVIFGAGLLIRASRAVALAFIAVGVLLMLIYVVGRPLETIRDITRD